MEQIARECQVGLVSYTITHHTRQSAIGLPYIVQKEYGGRQHSVTEYTMSEIVASIYNRMEETGLAEGILFIDEINCVSETLAPMMLQFLQCKTFGNHRIPDGWLIVTAGNPPEYNKSVREFDIATLDGKRFATPRGWEDLARFLEIYEKLEKTVDRDVIYQYIEHPGIAKDFANYLELYRKYKTDYQIGRILSGEPDKEMVRRVSSAPFDERFSVISLILAHLNGKFREVYIKEQYLELLKKELEELKRMTVQLVERQEQTVPALLKKMALDMKEGLEKRRRAGLIGKGEEHLLRDVSEKLEYYALSLVKEHIALPQEGFSKVCEFFSEEIRKYDSLSEQGLEMLEHGFDFMEAAFASGQEMANNCCFTQNNRDISAVSSKATLETDKEDLIER